MAAIDQLNDRLLELPPEVDPWAAAGLKLDLAQPNGFGLWYIKRVLPGKQDMQLSVAVKDQNGLPLSDIAVLFGFHTGQKYYAPPLNYPDQFNDIIGNMQYTNGAGEAFHSAGQSGVDIAIIDYQINERGVKFIGRPTDIIWNVPILGNPPGSYNHTGVHIEIWRYTPGVGTHTEVHADIEARLRALEGR